MTCRVERMLEATERVRFFGRMEASEMAVIADVHGNAWALEAVLNDIRRRGVKAIVNLGDNANGPLEPARCVQMLQASGAVHVRGNGDRMTGEGGPTVRGSASYARERLDDEARRWLRELPFSAGGEGWVAFHATLRSDEEYLFENPAAGKTVLASRAQIAGRMGAVGDATLALCGHTHIPRMARLDTGVLVVNPGSVGLPAYDDTTPELHAIENGSPDARYAILRRAGSEWAVEFVAVPYDWRTAGAAARAAGWEDWARNLETGYA